MGIAHRLGNHFGCKPQKRKKEVARLPEANMPGQNNATTSQIKCFSQILLPLDTEITIKILLSTVVVKTQHINKADTHMLEHCADGLGDLFRRHLRERFLQIVAGDVDTPALEMRGQLSQPLSQTKCQ